jgi:hypothetical protein
MVIMAKKIKADKVKEKQDRQIIGSGGGSLVLTGRGHRLTIPAGAVSVDTEFTMIEPKSQFIIVLLLADGQHQFPFKPTSDPVVLTLNYKKRHAQLGEGEKPRIHQIRTGHGPEDIDAAPIIDTPPEHTDGTDASQEVSARLHRLSGYVIGAF